MINEMTLILISRLFHFKIGIFLVRHTMVFIFNLFVLLEWPAMVMTLIFVVKL